MQTLEDYISMYLDSNTKQQLFITEPARFNMEESYPSVVDWRKQGFVTAVKDQVSNRLSKFI